MFGMKDSQKSTKKYVQFYKQPKMNFYLGFCYTSILVNLSGVKNIIFKKLIPYNIENNARNSFFLEKRITFEEYPCLKCFFFPSSSH